MLWASPLNLKKNKNLKFKIKWGSSLVRVLIFPFSLSLHSILLSWRFTFLCTIIFLSSHFVLLHNTALIFALLFSTSHCYSFLHIITLIFTLLFDFPLHTISFLFQIQGFLCSYFPLHTTIFSSLCCYYWCVVIR